MESLEWKTFTKLYDRIHVAIRAGVGQLATKAFSKELLTSSQLNMATFLFFPPDQQATQFLAALRDRIEVHPASFMVFRDIMNSEPVYANIVSDIDTTLASFRRPEDRAFPVQVEKGKPPTIGQLVDHVKTTNWFRLGRKLGVEEFDLDVIAKNNPQDAESALETTLKKWYKITAKPTWGAVVDALMAIQEIQLATELKEAFC